MWIENILTWIENILIKIRAYCPKSNNYLKNRTNTIKLYALFSAGIYSTVPMLAEMELLFSRAIFNLDLIF